MRAACPVATFARQGLHCSGARPAACRSWLIKPHWPVPTATRGGAGIGAGFGRTVPRTAGAAMAWGRSEEHTSELQSRLHLVCRLLLEKKKYIHHRCFLLDRPGFRSVASAPFLAARLAGVVGRRVRRQIWRDTDSTSCLAARCCAVSVF